MRATKQYSHAIADFLMGISRDAVAHQKGLVCAFCGKEIVLCHHCQSMKQPHPILACAGNGFVHTEARNKSGKPSVGTAYNPHSCYMDVDSWNPVKRIDGIIQNLAYPVLTVDQRKRLEHMKSMLSEMEGAK